MDNLIEEIALLLDELGFCESDEESIRQVALSLTDLSLLNGGNV
ncbi:MAG: hypothetical protein P4L69_12710 [Desulfosporosinus sp.]|nr:hypothetical protein [Desulfosporosinus sp.]